MYALIYYICFSLSELPHSVWQALGSSPSLELTQICSFLSLIFHCICVPHLLYPFICWWTSRLLPCPQVSRSVVSDSVAPWTTAHQASLSMTNSWSLLKLMSIESVMPSSHFIFCCPLLLLPSVFPSISVFSNESALPIRWPKYWSFSFNISPSNEHSGLISLRMDWLDLLTVQGTLESSLTPQLKSINSSVLNFLYSPTLTLILLCILGYMCESDRILKFPWLSSNAVVLGSHFSHLGVMILDQWNKSRGVMGGEGINIFFSKFLSDSSATLRLEATVCISHADILITDPREAQWVRGSWNPGTSSNDPSMPYKCPFPPL